jgi:integrase
LKGNMANVVFLWKELVMSVTRGLTKQARVLSVTQQKVILAYFSKSRDAKRNRVIFFLSVKLGLRACEIANLCWMHVLDELSKGVGDTIRITNDISKGKRGGRKFKMGREIIEALQDLYADHDTSPTWYDRVVINQFGSTFTPNGISRLFYYWYKQVLNWDGYSSHSGRRTFITNAARKAGLCGGSIYDVQFMAGHSSLQSTQGYIEANEDAQERIVNMI